jgi:hypothetical protein
MDVRMSWISEALEDGREVDGWAVAICCRGEAGHPVAANMRRICR